MVLPLRLAFFLWISGFLVAIGLMVIDEVLTLARYCGLDCYYEVPYIGGLTQYGAEIFAWLLILTGFAIMMGLSLLQVIEVNRNLKPAKAKVEP